MKHSLSTTVESPLPDGRIIEVLLRSAQPFDVSYLTESQLRKTNFIVSPAFDLGTLGSAGYFALSTSPVCVTACTITDPLRTLTKAMLSLHLSDDSTKRFVRFCGSLASSLQSVPLKQLN